MNPKVLLILAAVCWSTGGLFLKSPPVEQVSHGPGAPVVACARAFFAAVFFLPFLFRGPRSAIRARFVFHPAMIPSTLCYTAMNILLVMAMARTTAAAAIFLFFTSVAWGSLFAVTFLRERLDRANLIAIAFAMLGIALIVLREADGSEAMIGNLCALGSGAAYGGLIVCLRAMRDVDPFLLVTINHGAACLILLPFALFGSSQINFTAALWGVLLVMGVVQLGLPYLLFSKAVQTVTAQEAALLTLLEPVLNPIWVWLAYAETPGGSTLIGGGCILCGLILRYGIAGRSRDKPVARST